MIRRDTADANWKTFADAQATFRGADVYGESRVSEVVNGKRNIGKEQAKKLASFFQVSAGIFIRMAALQPSHESYFRPTALKAELFVDANHRRTG